MSLSVGRSAPGPRLAFSSAALLFLIAASSISPAAPSTDGLLVDRHRAAAVACAGCHREQAPHGPPPSGVCADCHGDYATIAAKTADVQPNPHASHQGDLPCDRCHHVHKPSVDFCAQCHDWGFKVP